MRALTAFLFKHLEALLTKSLEDRSDTEDRIVKSNIVLVSRCDPLSEAVVLNDGSHSIWAFLPPTFVAQARAEYPHIVSTKNLCGCLLRIEECHFSTPFRHRRGTPHAASHARRICLNVLDLSILDVADIQANEQPHVLRDPTILRLLEDKSLAFLEALLLPPSTQQYHAYIFGDRNPLTIEDCEIPAEQLTILEGEETNGAMTDSQLIAENGSVPNESESQSASIVFDTQFPEQKASSETESENGSPEPLDTDPGNRPASFDFAPHTQPASLDYASQDQPASLDYAPQTQANDSSSQSVDGPVAFCHQSLTQYGSTPSSSHRNDDTGPQSPQLSSLSSTQSEEERPTAFVPQNLSENFIQDDVETASLSSTVKEEKFFENNPQVSTTATTQDIEVIVIDSSDEDNTAEICSVQSRASSQRSLQRRSKTKTTAPKTLMSRFEWTDDSSDIQLLPNMYSQRKSLPVSQSSPSQTQSISSHTRLESSEQELLAVLNDDKEDDPGEFFRKVHLRPEIRDGRLFAIQVAVSECTAVVRELYASGKDRQRIKRLRTGEVMI
ncbi:hypothetical protein Ae201684P_007843 [Aphanomyces euteiches]|uniref:Uncharacterized protein n=1 Tax=Aphanomyces euteiches TaxID=100861 RepID=A0A6G0XS09_9STRA|nr:hypothetical protein Ae201684_001853 [Aphanomyces euteiches]KAH9089675.1 hypothetical protein Ae201684P_007843 [Aphanomyces euteiches]